MRSMHANAVRPFSVRNRDVIMNVQSLHVVVSTCPARVRCFLCLLVGMVFWNMWWLRRLICCQIISKVRYPCTESVYLSLPCDFLSVCLILPPLASGRVS